MAARLVAAEDAVRRRIERDLHDGAQQRLVMAALGVRLARATLGPSADPEVVELLTNSLAMLDTAVGELRELARGVRPRSSPTPGWSPRCGRSRCVRRSRSASRRQTTCPASNRLSKLPATSSSRRR